MDYEMVIRTDAAGQPRIESQSGPLPANATITVKGGEGEDADPWGELIVVNDVIIHTGAVTGIRVSALERAALADPVVMSAIHEARTNARGLLQRRP